MSHIDQYLCDNPHCTKETTDPISDFWIHFDCHGDDGCTLKKGKGILLTDLQDRDFCSMDCLLEVLDTSKVIKEKTPEKVSQRGYTSKRPMSVPKLGTGSRKAYEWIWTCPTLQECLVGFRERYTKWKVSDEDLTAIWKYYHPQQCSPPVELDDNQDFNSITEIVDPEISKNNGFFVGAKVVQVKGAQRAFGVGDVTQIRPNGDLDADDWKICLKNGVYDLKTHTLQEHSRYVQVEYQPGRLCPMWTAFLDRIFRSRDDRAELIDFLQRAAGYSLTGSTQEQCLFLLYGSGNGKSVFLEVLRAALGGSRGYAKVCDASTFTTARTDAVRNDIAALAGVRLVTTNENPPGSSIDEALIKELTGEREITARFLFKDYFTYRPRFKIWWAFNHQPRVGDGTWSMWRRIRLIPFQEQIPPEEQNPHLAEDLVAAELPGILNWCLEGLKKYQESGLPVPADHFASYQTKKQDEDQALAAAVEES